MPEISSSKYLVQAGWDDVPHLSAEAKKELYDATPPYMRGARSKGTPQLGAGAIYPVDWEGMEVGPFPIPPFWRRCYAMDVGWKITAVMWFAENPADGTLYAYGEYYQGKKLPMVHARGIKLRGEWIPGCIDPAARGRSQRDGKKLMDDYQGEGLDLAVANNAVEPGLYNVWSLMETGRLKFFTTLQHTKNEAGLYRRVRKVDENGVTKLKIVKKNDHLMDCLRYGVNTFDEIAVVRPADTRDGIGGRQIADRKAGY